MCLVVECQGKAGHAKQRGWREGYGITTLTRVSTVTFPTVTTHPGYAMLLGDDFEAGEVLVVAWVGRLV